MKIYFKSNKQFCDNAQIKAKTISLKHNANGAENIILWSTNKYDCCDDEYRINADKLEINVTKVQIGWITTDN